MSRSFFRARLQGAGIIEKCHATTPLEKLELSIDNDIALKVDIEDPAEISSYVHCTRGGTTRPLFGRHIQVDQVYSKLSKTRKERRRFRSRTVYRSVTLQRSLSHRTSGSPKRRYSSSSSSLEKTRRSRRKRSRTCSSFRSDKSSPQSNKSECRFPSAGLLASSSSFRRRGAFANLIDHHPSQQILHGCGWKQYEYHRGYYSC